MTAFVFASPPEKVPRPECSVDQVTDAFPSYDVVQLATVDAYLFVMVPLAYAVCKIENPETTTTDVGLKSQIWDYGNNRYRRIKIGFLDKPPLGILPKHYLNLHKPPAPC